MSLVGNHPQQTSFGAVVKSHVDDRETAPDVFGPLHQRFAFTVDVAASQHNAKLKHYYTLEDDGLSQSWVGERVWCNPPYSAIEPWVVKAASEAAASPGAGLVVMLVPANRTEQGWWQRHIEPHRDRGGLLRTEFIRGRLRFIAPGADRIGPNERPPFGCVLLIWERAA